MRRLKKMLKPKAIGLVVRPDKLEEADPVYARAKAAGLALAPHDDLKREQAGVDKGTVVALGGVAFQAYGGSPEDWCQVGDYIAYARYAGKTVKDPETGEDLLIINDEDYVCTIIGVAKDA
jgi:co-chaperonin GroES (HSP10)